jgi:EAL domain-containing protein (putative c-di-GMP-specific phosphodiesterase class I)
MKKFARLFFFMPTLALLIAASCYLSIKAVESFIIERKEAAVHNMAQSLLPVLMVGDTQQIDTLLKTLSTNSGIESAELISGSGIPLAAYVREGVTVDPTQSQFALASVEDGMNAYELRVVAPLTFDTQILANLHVAINLWPAYLRVMQILGALLILPSMLYVLIRQLRIKIRFERIADDNNSDNHFKIDQALQEALKESDISLEYQPIKRLADKGIFGAEVMVCWKHPSGQTMHVSPADFIVLAEQSGLFLPLGNWVLETACGHFSDWQPQHGPLVLSINIAPSQLKDPDFYQKVRAACAAGQFPYQLIEFEINEAVLLRSPSALAQVEAFVQQGMSLTIDGFGLSSRSHELLQSMSIHKIKFSPQLVKKISHDAQILSHVQSFVRLALAHDVQMIADGLQSEAQIQTMQQFGCILGQGSHLSHALSPIQFEALLVAQAHGVNSTQQVHARKLHGAALSY